MSKSSINIQPVKAGSEEHNQRLKTYDYVREDLSSLNGSYIQETISSALERIKNTYQKNTGQKMQKKATPIREGVVLIREEHQVEDLIRLGQKLQDKFGIKLIQAYTHKDEGHWREGVWAANLHGHMVFDWTDEKGKSIKLNRYQMSEMQTLVAEELGMERGISSDKKHLSAVSFKVQEEEKRLLHLQNELKDQLDIGEEQLIQYKETNLLNIFGKNKEIDTPSTLSNYKKSLQSAKLKIREKEKEIQLFQKSFLSAQKEIDSLKKQKEKLHQENQMLSKREVLLLSNHSYYTTIRKALIDTYVKSITENYFSAMIETLNKTHRIHPKLNLIEILSEFTKHEKKVKTSLYQGYDFTDDLKKDCITEA